MDSEKKDKKGKGRKPSYRQTKAVEFWVRDGRGNKAKALRMAGYSSAVSRHPDKVFNSPIVQKFMREAGIQEQVILPKIKTEEEMRGSIDQDANIQVVNFAEERMKFAVRVVQMSAEERRVMSAAFDAELERRDKLEEKLRTPQFIYKKEKIGYPTEAPYSYRYNIGGDPYSGF